MVELFEADDSIEEEVVGRLYGVANSFSHIAEVDFFSSTGIGC